MTDNSANRISSSGITDHHPQPADDLNAGGLQSAYSTTPDSSALSTIAINFIDILLNSFTIFFISYN